MILLCIALAAFFFVGWDTWDAVAFLPWTEFTQQGLAWVLAREHTALWGSLAACVSGVFVAHLLPIRRLTSLCAGACFIAAIGLALLPSIGGRGVDLGLGPLIYLSALVCYLGQIAARCGWIGRDTFATQATLVCGSMVLLFIFYPIATVFTTALDDFIPRLHTYGALGGIYWNTLQLALLTGALTTLLAAALSLIVTRSRHLRVGTFLKQVTMLPLLTPPFVVGLSLIFLFGRSGLITNQVFGLSENFIFGLPGLVAAQVLSFLPPAFMVIVSGLEGMDATLEEASATLGANYGTTLHRVTWQLLRPAVANAFLLTIMESFADFANPIVIGGDYHVLSTEIYFAVIGKYDLPLAASLGIVLLISTLVFFVLQHVWLGKRSYVTVTGKPQARVLPTLPKRFDLALTTFCGAFGAFTLALYLFFFYGSFVKIWGIDTTLTLNNYRLFWIDAKDSLITTLVLSFIAAPLTAILGLLLAYIVQRKSFVGRRTMEFLALLAFAIPGTVVGIGYLVAFHNPPFALTGTAMILLLCFIFRNMPVGMRAGIAALSQIDRSLEDASLTLRASTATTLRRIVLPLGQGAVITAIATSFVRAITAVSAVVFLVSAEYNLATRVILDRMEYGKLGMATAYCVVLVVIMGTVVALSQWLVRHCAGKRMLAVEHYATH